MEIAKITPSMTMEQFDVHCDRLGQAGTAYRFAIGDAVNFAKEKGWHTRESFNRMKEKTGYSSRMVHTCAQVARAFPLERRAELSFYHHRAVLSLPESKQDEILQKASDEELSVMDIEEIVKPKKEYDYFNPHNLCKTWIDFVYKEEAERYKNDHPRAGLLFSGLDRRSFPAIHAEFMELYRELNGLFRSDILPADLNKWDFFDSSARGFQKRFLKNHSELAEAHLNKAYARLTDEMTTEDKQSIVQRAWMELSLLGANSELSDYYLRQEGLEW